MTDYCKLEDLDSLLTGLVINDSSNITSTQVTNEIIPDINQYMDDRLAQFYVTPITGTNALKTMNRIAKYLVAAEIMDRIYMGQTPSDSPQANTWRKLAEATLGKIVDGEIILYDAVSTGDTPESKSNLFSDKLSQPTRQTPPRFSMGMKF